MEQRCLRHSRAAGLQDPLSPGGFYHSQCSEDYLKGMSKKIYVDSELRKKSACGGGNRVRMEGVLPETEGFRLNPDSHSLAGDLRQIT